MLQALFSNSQIREMVEEEVLRQERIARADVRVRGWRWLGASKYCKVLPTTVPQALNHSETTTPPPRPAIIGRSDESKRRSLFLAFVKRIEKR